MTYSLHHVHLICRDLEKMISFFEEAIGTKLVERRKFGTADGATLDLQALNRTVLEKHRLRVKHRAAVRATYAYRLGRHN